jgi:hypothetical protein
MQRIPEHMEEVGAIGYLQQGIVLQLMRVDEIGNN